VTHVSWKAAQMERTMVKGSLLKILQRSSERTAHWTSFGVSRFSRSGVVSYEINNGRGFDVQASASLTQTKIPSSRKST
jgi:hypothetical protein